MKAFARLLTGGSGQQLELPLQSECLESKPDSESTAFLNSGSEGEETKAKNQHVRHEPGAKV